MEVEAARKIFSQLYDRVDGFSTSMDNRKRQNLQQRELTYGEITFDTFAAILDIVDPQPDEVFYDLGCGVGKPVITATLLRKWKKLVGVEILEDLYIEAEKVREHLEVLTSALPEPLPPIQFVNSDISTYDFFDGDIIYIASTCFDYGFMAAFSKKCDTLKPGARIITLTKELSGDHLELKEKLSLMMSWGNTTINIYERSR